MKRSMRSSRGISRAATPSAVRHEGASKAASSTKSSRTPHGHGPSNAEHESVSARSTRASRRSALGTSFMFSGRRCRAKHRAHRLRFSRAKGLRPPYGSEAYGSERAMIGPYSWCTAPTTVCFSRGVAACDPVAGSGCTETEVCDFVQSEASPSLGCEAVKGWRARRGVLVRDRLALWSGPPMHGRTVPSVLLRGRRLQGRRRAVPRVRGTDGNRRHVWGAPGVQAPGRGVQ